MNVRIYKRMKNENPGVGRPLWVRQKYNQIKTMLWINDINDKWYLYCRHPLFEAFILWRGLCYGRINKDSGGKRTTTSTEIIPPLPHCPPIASEKFITGIPFFSLFFMEPDSEDWKIYWFDIFSIRGAEDMLQKRIRTYAKVTQSKLFSKSCNANILYFSARWRILINICHFVTFENSKTISRFNRKKH